MKIEINNRGVGDDLRLVLEPATIGKGLLNLAVFVVDYSGNGAPGKRVRQAEVVISAQDLKVAMDSLIKVCGKPN